MARKPNYDFEKRRKELARKQKQEEKRLRKLDEDAAAVEQLPLNNAPATPAADPPG